MLEKCIHRETENRECWTEEIRKKWNEEEKNAAATERISSDLRQYSSRINHFKYKKYEQEKE